MKANLKWIYLIILTFIWGSSFILMKKALVGFDAVHIGALRILICTTFLLFFFHKSLRGITKQQWKWIALSGFVGSLLPAYLFTYAVKNIGSSIPSILNSFTPLNTLLVGVLFFGFSFNKKQLMGILIGLFGTVMLIYQGSELNPTQNYYYAILPLICSVGYAFNANIIKIKLAEVKPIAITTGNFVVIAIPTIIVLVYTDFFRQVQLNNKTQTAFMYIMILAVVATAVAKITFNNLIQIATPVFSSSVTYLIPIVAISWGLLDGELLNVIQLVSGIIILLGVWLVNKNK